MHKVQIHFFFVVFRLLLEKFMWNIIELEFYLETHITIMTDWYTITRRLLNHCWSVTHGFSLGKMYIFTVWIDVKNGLYEKNIFPLNVKTR